MLVINTRSYKKQYVIGGSGIFDTVTNFIKRIAASDAAKVVASKISSAAQTELGKKAIEAGKMIAKEVGLKAIDVGKDVVIAKAKTLITNRAPKNRREVLTQKSKDTLAALINMEPYETGSGVMNAITIQDLVKRLNFGAGLRQV